MWQILKNIKTEHKILFSLFILVFLIFLYSHYFFKVGLFFDQSVMFMPVIPQIDANSYLLFDDRKIRFFNNFLVSVPFNILYIIYKNSVDKINLLNVINLFTVSYFIVQIFAIFLNVLVAIRTKRYDIAVIGFAFYTLFCLPNALWAGREMHISVLFYFILLSYFLSKEKLNKTDLIPVLLLLIYLFESFEVTTILLSVLLIIFANMYTINTKNHNLGFKNLIGSVCFFVIIYILVRLNYEFSGERGAAIDTYLFGITFYLKNLFNSNALISVFGVLGIIIAFFKKKDVFKLKDVVPISLYILFSLVILYKRTSFNQDGGIELQAFGGTLIFLFPVIITILLLDYKNIEISKYKPAFISNLFVIACIVGIFQLMWQINGTFLFGKYVNYLKNIINTSNEMFIEVPKEDRDNNYYFRYMLAFGVPIQSIFINENQVIDKIIVPPEYDSDGIDWRDPNYIHYGRDENEIIINNVMFLAAHKKYKDLTPIIENFEKERNKQKTTEENQ